MVESDQGLWPAVSVNLFQSVRCVVARGDRAAGIRHGDGSCLLRLIVCGRVQSAFMRIGASRGRQRGESERKLSGDKGWREKFEQNDDPEYMNRGGVLPDAAQQHGADRQNRGDDGITGNDFPESVHGCLSNGGLSMITDLTARARR